MKKIMTLTVALIVLVSTGIIKSAPKAPRLQKKTGNPSYLETQRFLCAKHKQTRRCLIPRELEIPKGYTA